MESHAQKEAPLNLLLRWVSVRSLNSQKSFQALRESIFFDSRGVVLIWVEVPTRKVTSQWKITIFNRRYIFNGCFSIIMLVFGGVVEIHPQNSMHSSRGEPPVTVRSKQGNLDTFCCPKNITKDLCQG